MSILRKLFSQTDSGAPSSSADTDSVRKIVSKLEALDPDEARYLAAYAYILGRVAHADLDISPEESTTMERLVREKSGLAEAEALLVVEIAKNQNRLFGGTENFLVTREFSKIASRQKRLELLDCLFAVSAADASISSVEEEQVRGISTELGLTHQEYVEARQRYSEYRAVMKGMRETPSEQDGGSE